MSALAADTGPRLEGVSQSAPTEERLDPPATALDSGDPRFGVRRSRLAAYDGPRLRRGGGYEKVGKAYRIKGKWYKPSADPHKAEVGRASWYGTQFHGRLTANGEIFDMNHLSAAHRTFPLPSYARVTNIRNGRSILVRVNDRGPFAHNRIIDLSRRTAEVLGFKHSGTTDVKVEYAGPAPLHGNDDDFLLASYDDGTSGAPTADPQVLVAVAGPTVDGKPHIAEGAALVASVGANPIGLGLRNVALPDVGPVILNRPAYDPFAGSDSFPPAPAVLSGYADLRVKLSAFGKLMGDDGLTADMVARSWKNVSDR